MIALIRLHTYYILTKKTRLLSILFTLTMLSILWLLTRPFDSRIAHILYRSTYLLDYTIEGVTLIKMAILMTGLYTVMHLTILAPYDIVLIQRTRHITYTLSKYLTIWLLVAIIATILSLYFTVFSLLMYKDVHPMISWHTGGRLLIFTTMYTLILYMVSLYTKHQLALILVMFAYFISELFVNITPHTHQVSSLGIITNMIAPNLHILSHTTINFVLPLRVLGSLLILYLLGIIHAQLTYKN